MISGRLKGLVDRQNRAVLNGLGQSLTVERRGASQGAAPTQRTVTLTPVPLNRAEAQSFAAEAGLNLGETLPVKFLATGDTDLREAIDWVLYNGFAYRLVTVVPIPVQGSNVLIRAFGVRQGVE